ncbi:MAG: amphi-Trp domain-containing protein [Candidatus Nanohaloarchaea archaeon]
MIKLEKEFNLSNKDAAEFLRDLADSVENGRMAMDGEDWKIYHEIDGVPMRIHKDDQGTEIGLKLLQQKRNQA